MANWRDSNCGTDYFKNSAWCGKNRDGTVRACTIPNRCWHFPTNNTIINCTNDNKQYLYNEEGGKKLFLVDTNIINTYNYENWQIPNLESKYDRDNTGNNSNCDAQEWSGVSKLTVPNSFLSTNVNEGSSVKCFDRDQSRIYRWANGKTMLYPTPEIAVSWDRNYQNASFYKCEGLDTSVTMETKPNNGDIIKCSDNEDKYYSYKDTNLTYYPLINDAIVRQYNNYTGQPWNTTMTQTKNCEQYNPNRIEVDANKPLTTNTIDGTSLKCYKQNKEAIFRYSSDNNSIINYPNNETAFTWDNGYLNYQIYDCSGIWANNSGINYNLATSKPGDGSIVKCSDDGKLYRYAADNNKLLLYETPSIAKQYSNFQMIQELELDISTGTKNFAVTPIYNVNTLPAYTFSFECYIENNAPDWRNIMNHGQDDNPTDGDGRRPAIYITGNNVSPPNRINIVHSNDGDVYGNIVSDFEASLKTWFTITMIVNNSTMFTYFNGRKDKSYTNGKSFNWGTKNRENWKWNIHGPSTDGSVKVRNVRFWSFPMALEWPETFNPIETTDEIDPYSLKPTGNKIHTTTIPPPTNCKAYSKDRGIFTPTYSITSTTIKDGDTLKCKDDNSNIYRYNQERDKIFKYQDLNIAQSWDPNYKNYKAYNCGTYKENDGIMDIKPKNNHVIKCTDDNKSYRFINDTNKLEWYKNDNIIKQYNPDWLITDRLTRNCEQFKKDRTTFIPTQKVSLDTTTLKDGMALKCDNKDDIYRYNRRYDVLMKYKNEIMGNSWDPTSYNGYYSYTCDPKYTQEPVPEMSDRPRVNSVIKCNNLPDNRFYYTYNYEDNTLSPNPDINSIKNKFPSWNVNNIQPSDCRQYYLREPRFYDGPNGTGKQTLVNPENYNKCNPLPYIPTDILNRSFVRDGENILIYTDSSCNNIYKNDNGENGKDKAINLTYTNTNSYGDILNESNPSHYKIVSDDEYYTIYAKELPLRAVPPPVPPNMNRLF